MLVSKDTLNDLREIASRNAGRQGSSRVDADRDRNLLLSIFTEFLRDVDLDAGTLTRESLSDARRMLVAIESATR